MTSGPASADMKRLLESTGWSLTRRLATLDLPVDLTELMVRLDSLEPRTLLVETDENSDGQSVVSVRQEECSRTEGVTLGVTLILPPMVVAFDETDVTLHWLLSLNTLPGFESGPGWDRWTGPNDDCLCLRPFLDPLCLWDRLSEWGHWSHSQDEQDNSWNINQKATINKLILSW